MARISRLRHRLLLTVVLAGCDGATSAIPSSAVGVYTLAAVDGRALPASLGPTSPQALTAVRGSLELRADGEYLQVIETRYLDSDGNARTGVNASRGDFSGRGGRISLRETLGATREASLDAGTLRYAISVGARDVTLDWRR